MLMHILRGFAKAISTHMIIEPLEWPGNIESDYLIIMRIQVRGSSVRMSEMDAKRQAWEEGNCERAGHRWRMPLCGEAPGLIR